jgi:hypothetical protein
VEVLQRGATNVTIPETTTALDIPEPTVALRDIDAEIRQHRNFEDVRSAPHGPRASVLIELICEDLGVDADAVRRVVDAGEDRDGEVRAAREGLMSDEWLAFQQAIDHPDEPVGTPHFQVSATPLASSDADGLQKLVAAHFGSVVLVHRLREIRALHGFRRYDLGADLVDVNLGPRGRDAWLPAVESFGEGVLLTLNEQRLAVWEQLPEVQRRVQIMERRRRDSLLASRFGETFPRMVLLHTLSHLLMRQLSYSCGYSAASLRERVYANAEQHQQAGILIYTAAGDSEGTLGGLVRQGETPRLLRTLYETLQSAAWCSNDPLCRESRGQGLGSLNLAACHGCCLVSETSCERSNLLLDRALVVGDEGSSDSGTVPGYLEAVIQHLQAAAVGRAVV